LEDVAKSIWSKALMQDAIPVLSQSMLINDQLVRDVRNAWIEDQNHPHRGRSQKPIPSEYDFSILLDTTFRASLLREEGRPISTSVTWVSPAEFESHEVGHGRDSRLALELDTPAVFEAYNVAKLSGVVNGKTGTLLVCRTESGVNIWSICYFIRENVAIGHIPAGTTEVRHSSPDFPTVTINGVGSVQITRGGSVIGRVEAGKFLKAHASILTSFMLGQYLYRLIGIENDCQSDHFKSQDDADIARTFFDCVDFIVEVLSQRRMGATIIFVPPSLKDRALIETDTVWRVHGSLEIDKLQRARLRYQKNAAESNNSAFLLCSLKIDHALRHRLRSLVDLAGIDGAVLLTPSFDVIGFGVKLKSTKWGRDIRHGPVAQPIDKQELDFSRLGTRHHSALNFVGSIDGAVAFVASSDGPIRALVKSTDEIVWYWPDCRVSMFAS
jgi:hypothetical protein